VTAVDGFTDEVFYIGFVVFSKNDWQTTAAQPMQDGSPDVHAMLGGTQDHRTGGLQAELLEPVVKPERVCHQFLGIDLTQVEGEPLAMKLEALIGSEILREWGDNFCGVGWGEVVLVHVPWVKPPEHGMEKVPIEGAEDLE
jgi:hypothetical protein